MPSDRIPTFPIYARLDDGAVIRIDSPSKVLRDLEAIDIENGEYQFWDADGHALHIVIKKGRVGGFQEAINSMTVQQALAEYANQLGVSLDAQGTASDEWQRLAEAKKSMRKRRGALSRLFSKGE